MSLKARIKPYIFAFGLIFSLFFYSTAIAVDNPTWTTVDGQYTTGASFEVYYDEDNYLTLFSSFADAYNYPNYPFTPEKIIFNKTYNWNGAYTLDFFTITISGSNYYLAGAICNSLHTVSTNVYYGSYRDWCSVDRNEIDVPIKFFSLHSGGNYTPVIYNSNGLTKTDFDNYFGMDSLETNGVIKQVTPFVVNSDYSSYSGTGIVYDYPNLAQTFPIGSSAPPEPIDGTCGTGHDTIVYTEPTGTEACLTGDISNMVQGQNELQTETYFLWNCLGSNGGSNESCWATMGNEINGTCGTANGQTLSEEPTASQMCSNGFNGESLLTTLNGWTWSCYGFNGGSTDFCSATNNGAETPPTIPDSSIIPTPTDCESYSGIDKILCNLGNVIQGMFLPSSEKVIELQTTMNEVGNVFPFNYLRAISSVFNNLNFANGSLTMTMWGNTETLGEDFWEMEIFDNIKLAFTVLILLMFTFWAINYIKHFFK